MAGSEMAGLGYTRAYCEQLPAYPLAIGSASRVLKSLATTKNVHDAMAFAEVAAGAQRVALAGDTFAALMATKRLKAREATRTLGCYSMSCEWLAGSCIPVAVIAAILVLGEHSTNRAAGAGAVPDVVPHKGRHKRREQGMLDELIEAVVDECMSD
jgi:hypothetical protein